MSISEYFIPFTRMGINLWGQRLFIGIGRRGPQRAHSLGNTEAAKEPRGRVWEHRATIAI